MREHQPKYVDTITLIALVLMLLSGAMAVQRFLTAEQPGLAPDLQLRGALLIILLEGHRT
jgi:hypothetical protein